MRRSLLHADRRRRVVSASRIANVGQPSCGSWMFSNSRCLWMLMDVYRCLCVCLGLLDLVYDSNIIFQKKKKNVNKKNKKMGLHIIFQFISLG